MGSEKNDLVKAFKFAYKRLSDEMGFDPGCGDCTVLLAHSKKEGVQIQLKFTRDDYNFMDEKYSGLDLDKYREKQIARITLQNSRSKWGE